MGQIILGLPESQNPRLLMGKTRGSQRVWDAGNASGSNKGDPQGESLARTKEQNRDAIPRALMTGGQGGLPWGQELPQGIPLGPTFRLVFPPAVVLLVVRPSLNGTLPHNCDRHGLPAHSVRLGEGKANMLGHPSVNHWELLWNQQ